MDALKLAGNTKCFDASTCSPASRSDNTFRSKAIPIALVGVSGDGASWADPDSDGVVSSAFCSDSVGAEAPPVGSFLFTVMLVW